MSHVTNAPLMQYQCATCGIYTRAVPADQQPSAETTPDHHPEAWVTTGLSCPNCSAIFDN